MPPIAWLGQQALARGLEVEGMLESVTQRAHAIDHYITSYRHYTSASEGIEGLSFAPFHILATEGKVHTDKPHT